VSCSGRAEFATYDVIYNTPSVCYTGCYVAVYTQPLALQCTNSNASKIIQAMPKAAARTQSRSSPGQPVGPGNSGNPPRIAAPPALRSPVTPAAEPNVAAGGRDLLLANGDARDSEDPKANSPGGDGGPGTGSDSDCDSRIPFSVHDIPVSRRSGDHARIANVGVPVLDFDKNGVRCL
jgi:hypothetical protein